MQVHVSTYEEKKMKYNFPKCEPFTEVKINLSVRTLKQSARLFCKASVKHLGYQGQQKMQQNGSNNHCFSLCTNNSSSWKKTEKCQMQNTLEYKNILLERKAILPCWELL